MGTGAAVAHLHCRHIARKHGLYGSGAAEQARRRAPPGCPSCPHRGASPIQRHAALLCARICRAVVLQCARAPWGSTAMPWLLYKLSKGRIGPPLHVCMQARVDEVIEGCSDLVLQLYSDCISKARRLACCSACECKQSWREGVAVGVPALPPGWWACLLLEAPMRPLSKGPSRASLPTPISTLHPSTHTAGRPCGARKLLCPARALCQRWRRHRQGRAHRLPVAPAGRQRHRLVCGERPHRGGWVPPPLPAEQLHDGWLIGSGRRAVNAFHRQWWITHIIRSVGMPTLCMLTPAGPPQTSALPWSSGCTCASMGATALPARRAPLCLLLRA